jgi:type I restriction enzyme S subunit
MAVKWPVVCLRELCDAKRGITYGIVQPGTPQENGIPIIRADDVDDGWISTSNLMRVSPTVEASYSRSRIRGGEVLLTLVGAYFGKSAVAREEHRGFNTARAVGVIPVLQDADFISYALRSPICQSFINERATTTAQPTLNLSDVAAVPIPWPPEPMRGLITGILRSLDNKIELNQHMN